MALIRVVGFDPSLRHWGAACGVYDTLTSELRITHAEVIEPVIPTGKQVRQNNKDLEAAHQHGTAVLRIVAEAEAIFVEMPVGSQSARAMASYALCVGVLGMLRATGTTFYELTPTEVKKIATGKATATKKEMIDWAVQAHPEAPWPYYKRHGKALISETTAEHIADAIAAIYAGVDSAQFRAVISILHSKQLTPQN